MKEDVSPGNETTTTQVSCHPNVSPPVSSRGALLGLRYTGLLLPKDWLGISLDWPAKATAVLRLQAVVRPRQCWVLSQKYSKRARRSRRYSSEHLTTKKHVEIIEIKGVGIVLMR